MELEVVYQALARHPLLSDVPDAPTANTPHPVWQCIDHYRDGGDELGSCFTDAACLGVTGTKASIILLYLWIIIQTRDQPFFPNGQIALLPLVSTTIETGLRDRNIWDFYYAVKLLSRLFQECPLPEIIQDEFDALITARKDFDYSSLKSSAADLFPKNHALFPTTGPYDLTRSLLHQQDVVMVPGDYRAEQLIQWAIQKIGIGFAAESCDEYNKDKFWNVYLGLGQASSALRSQPEPSKGTESCDISTALSIGVAPSTLVPVFLQVATHRLEELRSDIRKKSKREWRYFVHLSLAVHPVHFLMRAPENIRLPWFDTVSHIFGFPVLRQKRPRTTHDEEIRARSEVMMYLLWIIGRRLPLYKVISLVSSAVEDSIIVSLRFDRTRDRSELVNNCPVAPADVDVAAILWSARSVIEEIALKIHEEGSNAPDGDGPFSSLPRDSEDVFIEGHELPSHAFEVDVKTGPSCLLRQQKMALSPKTKLTELVMVRLRDDFGMDLFDLPATPAGPEGETSAASAVLIAQTAAAASYDTGRGESS